MKSVSSFDLFSALSRNSYKQEYLSVIAAPMSVQLRLITKSWQWREQIASTSWYNFSITKGIPHTPLLDPILQNVSISNVAVIKGPPSDCRSTNRDFSNLRARAPLEPIWTEWCHVWGYDNLAAGLLVPVSVFAP